jgi:pseudouridine-5'-phosphate glycosidase
MAVIAVPIPAEDELPERTAEAAIHQAAAEAEMNSIYGKDVTPYLLKRVTELTAGNSRRANIALLVNNARTAGRIARAL